MVLKGKVNGRKWNWGKAKQNTEWGGEARTSEWGVGVRERYREEVEGNFATDELDGTRWREGCLVSGEGTLPERSWGGERKRWVKLVWGKKTEPRGERERSWGERDDGKGWAQIGWGEKAEIKKFGILFGDVRSATSDRGTLDKYHKYQKCLFLYEIRWKEGWKEKWPEKGLKELIFKVLW